MLKLSIQYCRVCIVVIHINIAAITWSSNKSFDYKLNRISLNGKAIINTVTVITFKQKVMPMHGRVQQQLSM